jgi:hypothetical protein
VAFDKVDGTNLHWDWDRDFGWHAFGTRRDAFNFLPDGIEQFGRRHEHLRGCVDLFRAALAEDLQRVFRDHAAYRSFAALTVFTEFVGPNSFAGLHRTDDPKRLVLFDVRAEGFGFLGPRQFVQDFGHLPIPRVIYEGPFTGRFTEDVRTGKHGVAEGVVCKGGSGGDDLWMVKVKTYAYLERLKTAFAEKWEDYWE